MLSLSVQRRPALSAVQSPVPLGLREGPLQLLFHLGLECASATRVLAWLSLGQPALPSRPHPLLQASPEQKRGTCSLVEGGRAQRQCQSRNPALGARWGEGGDSRVRHRSLCPHPPSKPDSCSHREGAKRAARVSGRQEPAPHAQGARGAPPAFGGAHGRVDFAASSRQPAPWEEGRPGAHPPTAAPGRQAGQGLRHHSHGTSLKHDVAHFYFISEKKQQNNIPFRRQGS